MLNWFTRTKNETFNKTQRKRWFKEPNSWRKRLQEKKPVIFRAIFISRNFQPNYSMQFSTEMNSIDIYNAMMTQHKSRDQNSNFYHPKKGKFPLLRFSIPIFFFDIFWSLKSEVTSQLNCIKLRTVINWLINFWVRDWLCWFLEKKKLMILCSWMKFRRNREIVRAWRQLRRKQSRTY